MLLEIVLFGCLQNAVGASCIPLFPATSSLVWLFDPVLKEYRQGCQGNTVAMAKRAVLQQTWAPNEAARMP